MVVNNNVTLCVLYICLAVIVGVIFSSMPPNSSNNDVKIKCYEAAKVNQNFKPSDCELKGK